MKAAFPGSLLVSPLSLYLAHMGQLPVDVKVTPLAGHQDLPGAWPLDTLDMLTVRGGRGRKEVGKEECDRTACLQWDGVGQDISSGVGCWRQGQSSWLW